MLYNYISKNELIDLVHNNKIAFIVNDICTKDIDEYVNSFINTLACLGLNESKINRPRIISIRRNKIYGIVIIFKSKQSDIKLDDISILKSLCKECNLHISNVSNYLHKVDRLPVNKYKNISENDIKEIIMNKSQLFIEFTAIGTKNKHLARINLKYNKQEGLIVNTEIKFDKPVDYKELNVQLLNYTVDVYDCKNNFRDIIATSCNQAYKLCRLNPSKLKIKHSNGKVDVYNIAITATSIDFTLS